MRNDHRGADCGAVLRRGCQRTVIGLSDATGHEATGSVRTLFADVNVPGTGRGDAMDHQGDVLYANASSQMSTRGTRAENGAMGHRSENIGADAPV